MDHITNRYLDLWILDLLPTIFGEETTVINVLQPKIYVMAVWITKYPDTGIKCRDNLHSSRTRRNSTKWVNCKDSPGNWRCGQGSGLLIGTKKGW